MPWNPERYNSPEKKDVIVLSEQDESDEKWEKILKFGDYLYEIECVVRIRKMIGEKTIEEEGVRRGRETAEYLKSLGYMGGKKDKRVV